MKEDLIINNILIRRRYDNISLRNKHHNSVYRPSNTRCSVSMYRFSHNMISSHLWQLFSDEFKIFIAGVYKNILLWKNMCKAVKSLLKLSPTHTKEVYKLLWVSFSTTGPQSSSFPSCKNHTKVILFRSHCLFKLTYFYFKDTLYKS